MKKPVSVFLSYASSDRRLCELLWVDLKVATRADDTYDITLWSMDKNLLAGDDFDREIRGGLDASDLGVFAVSHAMLCSDYIQRVELGHFLDSGKLLVPALLTNISAYADLRGLRPKQVYGWNDDYEACRSRAARRNWATGLAEELHRVLEARSAR
jgi:TIR domain